MANAGVVVMKSLLRSWGKNHPSDSQSSRTASTDDFDWLMSVNTRGVIYLLTSQQEGAFREIHRL